MRIAPLPIALAEPSLKPLSPPAENLHVKASSAKTGTADQARMQAACRDFEGVFLNLLLSQMRDTVPKDALLGESRGEEVFRGMLDEELSKQMAASGGVGLAEMLYRQLGPK